jgi:hypothetical protein
VQHPIRDASAYGEVGAPQRRGEPKNGKGNDDDDDDDGDRDGDGMVMVMVTL